MARFLLSRNGLTLAERDLGGSSPGGELVDVMELQPYGFAVTGAEDDTAYRVAIGDDVEHGDNRVELDGRRQQRAVFWDDKPWFESARGFVSVRLQSKSSGDDDEDDDWQTRANVLLYVRPSKLSEFRYLGMSQSLAGLSNELIFDVAGKATRGVGVQKATPATRGRPAHLELEAVDQLWRDIKNALAAITRQPVTATRRRVEFGACWGAERLLPASLAALASRGIDPRRPMVGRPFVALRERLEESVDTPEHRSIAGLLDVLLERLDDCQSAIETHIASIESERPFRIRGEELSGSLYETVDLPRLNRLNAALDRTRFLRRRVQRFRHCELFGKVVAEFTMPATPVFSHVVDYRRVRTAARRYLNGSLAIVDVGSDVRAKSTSRMFEQWVFIQVAAAFVRAGLKGDSAAQIRRQVEGARRFVVDLPRDARVSLRASDGREIRIRYEPHIFGREVASGRGDTVYAGTAGDSPWSPDVLVEVMKPGDGGVDEVEFAFVVDAKYSRTIRDHHWSVTSKYFQIRSTVSKLSVVRQVWLAHPSLAIGVRPRDTSITWSEHGPDVPVQEKIDGVIAAIPPECRSVEDEDSLVAHPFVSPAFMEFAVGMSSYLRLVD